MVDAVALAKGVLAVDGEPFKTLSLAPGFAAVTAETAVVEARRNYMRLAGLIHPDKIKASFDKATEAFQCLVRAFESFADPKARKAAAAAAAATAQLPQRGKANKVPAPRKTPKTSGPAESGAGKPASAKRRTKKVATAPPTKKSRTKAKRGDSDDEEDEDEDEEEEDHDETSSDDDDDDEGGFGAANEEPTVSTSHTPMGQPRTGGLYAETTIGCPHCRTRWEPDAKPQYSLFMGPWGKRVHCQLCLFVFGSATALHGCPHCTAPFDYDASMYEDTIKCVRCKKEFGFPYYPVNQYLVDMVRLEQWKEERDRAHAKDREARLQARRGGKPADEAAERLALLVGTCIMDDRCPLCQARVKSNHRAHVQACMAGGPQGPDKRKGKGAKGSTGGSTTTSQDATATVASTTTTTTAKPPAKKCAKAAVARPAAAKRTVANPKPKPAPKGKTAAGKSKKRRRSGSSSDDDDDEEDSSESESEASETESESEASFDDDDDDDEGDSSDDEE